MVHHSGASRAHPDTYDICYVRSRRVWPWRSSLVYEVVSTQGGQLRVVAATRKVPCESEAAAASLMQLTATLRQEGWEPTEEPRMVGQDIVTCFTRPIPREGVVSRGVSAGRPAARSTVRPGPV
jgi:hypothetical protein